MKTLFFALLLISVSLPSCGQTKSTVITNVDVFDGSIVLENVHFVFDANGIIGIHKKKKKYKNAVVIDGSGKTILPPMINAHVHVASPENLREAQQVGIFALMDMFSVDRRANNLRKFNDSLAYAHFYSSNVGATVPGGHGTQYGVVIPTVNDSISATEFVRDRINNGADYIKIAQEHTMAKLSTAQLEELITASHHNGKIALAHISALSEALELAALDVDGLAHIWYRKPAVATDLEIVLLKEKNLFIIPTLSVIRKLIDYTNENKIDDELLRFDEVLQEVNKVYKMGIPILAGTDARNFDMNYSTQYFEEFAFLSDAGMSNIDILRSGTSNIWNAFHLKEFQNLSKGRVASFILIDGKPHLNIGDIRNKKRIWKKGVEIDLG